MADPVSSIPYNVPMRHTAKFLAAGAFAFLLATGASSHVVRAQAPAQQPPAQPAAGAAAVPQQQPTFRVSVDLVTTDAIPRDERTQQFIADLKPGEFEIFEDGVKQNIVSMELIHGGRAYNMQAPPPAPVQEGIILPRSRPTNDAAGRVFLVFIDDLHLDFNQTPRLRTLLKDMLKNLIHDGDMFGVVSTGTSSIEQQLTYDRQILESISNKVSGGGLKPSDIVNSSNGVGQGSELRHRAHVAFSTAYDLVNNLQKVNNRRKAVIYISSGYDFNPFEKTRLEHQAEIMQAQTSDLENDPFFMQERSTNALGEADLIREEVELTRAANRANASFYTIDPRGLVAGQDMSDEVNNQDFQEYLRETQDSLRVLAENTGGFAIVNQNDLNKGLKRIDAETSDYYILGYYSSNPDPLRRTRQLEVKVTRPNIDVKHRTSYTFRQVSAPSSK
jgi:VWFA-related protein